MNDDGVESLIELFNVSKAFDRDAVALREVTLQIGRGEMMLLTGPSGAGKSTLLRIIFAAERPDRGEIAIAGRNVSRLQASSIPYLRRNIGVVFQDFKLLKDRTALQNVAIALEIRGIPHREVRRRAVEMLAAVGLQAMAGARANALSGGEQQRVAIARALVGEPAILLADEPTGNLDAMRAREVLALLRAACSRGTTVVVATHDPLVVEQVGCGRVAHLDQGRITRTVSATAGDRPVDGGASPSRLRALERIV